MPLILKELSKNSMTLRANRRLIKQVSQIYNYWLILKAMKKTTFYVIISVLASFLFSFEGMAQNVTDVAALKRISDSENEVYMLYKSEAVRYAKSNGIPLTIETPDGRFAEIQYIDISGRPQYFITDNSNAAKTISTNQVFAGGNAGISLSGAGITAREWDAAAVRSTHQEFGGRVVQGDGVTTLNYHSTHVAGTIMASGVNANAKGMAPEAQLRAFDWNNDASEMASEAANGALMSNHSYGYARGWNNSGNGWVWYGNPSISTQEDYLFGFYESQAQSWDNIARNAPYYLICKSAGNDRNEGPNGGPYPKDGPYDCIAHAGIAKNILTIGAVHDITTGYTGPESVVMSSFSSWGPADDGRIKPDIVANGVGLHSTDKDNDSDYTTLSGTSMATPSVTGSLALLQQHWNNLHPGTHMLAATLKALVIHTADEAGTSAGPDYQFGWGLMNTKSAALKISEDTSFNVMDELVLNNGGIYTRTIESDGTQPLKVTICWTDLPGTPVSAQLDPITPMLVNDLDLSLDHSTSTFYPWKLDRDNPTNPATSNTENDVDNVEMVYIDTPVAGTYTITVNHDGTLSGGSQAFSLIISGAVDTGTYPPACTNPLGPLDGSTDVAVNSSLSWETVSDATGYILYLGTDNPPTNLENGIDMGDVTEYTPAPEMDYNQTYYWQVVPYNAVGQAAGCSIWSFTTEIYPGISLPYSESFETNFGQWQQSTDDDFDWSRITGDTPTPRTSPKRAHNGLYYIYTEASNPQDPGDEASLEATFSFAGIPNPELSLWYYMYGSQMGTLHVDVYNGSWNYDVWTLSGQQQTTDRMAYRNAIINLGPFGNGTAVTIKIRGTLGSGERSDICLDLVAVRQQGSYAHSDPPSVQIVEDPLKTGQVQPGIPEESDMITMYAYDGNIILSNSNGEIIKGQVGIFNYIGQILKLIEIDGSSSYKLNPSLKPGIYIIRLTANNQVISNKILVE
jgi:subtilisin family serine protease